MSKAIHNSSFSSFCKQETVGFVSEDMHAEELYRQQLRNLKEERFLRKHKFFYENLPLIFKHREEILKTPRYANIDAHYLVEGGGCFIGRFETYRQFNFAGTLVTINLKLGTLLKMWENDLLHVPCPCGEKAFIYYFAGSPLSGSSISSAYCPHCGKKVKNVQTTSYLRRHTFVERSFREDIERVVKNVFEKWNKAKEACQKEIDDTAHPKAYVPRIGSFFYSEAEFCSLEEMIQELKWKDAEAEEPSSAGGN